VWVTVRRGDRGFFVAMVQRALIRKGISLVGGADGVFGQYTQAAVVRFQASVGLPANGIVDVATARQLGIVSGDVVQATTPPRRRRRGPTSASGPRARRWSPSSGR